MIAVLSVVDGMACAVVAWVCGAFLLSAHGSGVRSLVFNLSLLILAVGVVALAFLPLGGIGIAVWSLRAAKIAGAVVAVELYAQRLGWTAQARAVLELLAQRATQVRVLWRRLRDRSARKRSGRPT
ncbi:hypothetical protein [Lysobacter sp. CA199]|uniref:hypothetical protein n=1 Tax=Lysobacter sp. CA199 TaxID=3455608 RepID=UPI003F8D03A8